MVEMAYIFSAKLVEYLWRPFHQKGEKRIPENVKKGIPLQIRRGHTVRLQVTEEPLTVHTGLSLFYAMAEALEIPRIPDERIQVKERESGYPDSEHILALATNAFMGGDSHDDLDALREDVAIQKAIGRKDIPDPTTARDFCRRFTLGHILQMNRAFGEILAEVYRLRKGGRASRLGRLRWMRRFMRFLGGRKRDRRRAIPGSILCSPSMPLCTRRRS
jgi:hypothetical protein